MLMKLTPGGNPLKLIFNLKKKTFVDNIVIHCKIEFMTKIEFCKTKFLL